MEVTLLLANISAEYHAALRLSVLQYNYSVYYIDERHVMVVCFRFNFKCI